MIKEIQYRGFSAVPSDYECPDGDLSLSINMISEDGNIKPIQTPNVSIILEAPERIVFVHICYTSKHYVVLNQEAYSYRWFDDSMVDANSLKPDVMQPLTHSFSDIEVKHINAIGNTLFFVTSEGIHYFLWREELHSYDYLGIRPGFPEISFALGSSNTDNINAYSDSFKISLDVPKKLCPYVYKNWVFPTTDSNREPIGPSARYASSELSELVSAASNAVFAGLNKFITNSATNHLFTEPFFIRYALRLFDGSHILHSAPILMIPNSGSPLLPFVVNSFIIDESNDDPGQFEATTYIYHKALTIFFRVLCLNNLLDWKDIVTHIDFFISPPIYTYNQSGEIDPCSVASRNVGKTLFSHYGVYAFDSTRGVSESIMENHRHPENPIENPAYSFPSGNYEHIMDTSSNTMMVWNASPKKISEIEANVISESASLFYHVSSIEIGKLAEMDGFNPLDINDVNLLSLPTRQRLEDDYQSHHVVIPTVSHVYNSRLSIADISIRPFDGFSLSSSTQFFYPASISSPYRFANIYVGLRRNGLTQWVKSDSTQNSIFDSLESHFPRWIFYPDSSAFEMIVVETTDSNNTTWYRLPLSTHNSLEGAFWFRGLGTEMPMKHTGTLPTEITSQLPIKPIFEASNKVYTSEVNNPFYFPLKGINTVGSGKILGVASASKALSQGQFGQFPLYAFSSDGVWALQVADTGCYNAIQPITRDVVINAKSITPIDSAVLFITERGLMVLSGSTTSCISDSINSQDYFTLSSLPNNEFLKNYVGLTEDNMNIISFKTFLKECGILYDYVNQRIIVFNSSHNYAYIYSLKSKLWGMMESSIVSSVNAYPETLAMDCRYRLVNFSHMNDESDHIVNGLLISRPIKLNDANLYKTVDTLIQRGKFHKGHVKSILYGSRDLIKWHLVWYSQDHFLRGFRGTPYKYFRIALICNLEDNESIFGATVQFTPKLTNRPR